MKSTVAAMLVISGVTSFAPAAEVPVSELREFSLEQLMGLEVTSVSRKPEPFVSTAGAVAVLTGEDISQTGARTFADALRYAPGMQVARVDGRTWAVTARGFNASESNKLLVLMDGRTVYTPLFSGVFWDLQNTFFPDLDHIEVIRGPGATMWGANAVNGVVSITTKDARYTQGGLVTIGGGDEERAFGGVRYGGEIPGKLFYRVYAQSFYRDDLVNGDETGTGSDWRVTQGGFRIDSVGVEDGSGFTIQGDYYHGSIGDNIVQKSPITGGNILARLNRELSDRMEFTTQAYFDYVSRTVYKLYGEDRRTYDLDTQLRLTPFEHHEIVTGMAFRTSDDHTVTGGSTSFSPQSRRMTTGSAFVQDEMRWHDGRYGLIVGSKVEYNEGSGLDFQPSIRGALRNRDSTLWAAVSRAVRTPSRFDEDVRAGNPVRPSRIGNPDVDAETVLAYELGYRAQPASSFTWDLSLYYNDYDRLRSIERSLTAPSQRIEGNELLAETYGAEFSAKWQPVRRWRLQASYTYLGEKFHLAAGSTDPTGGQSEFNDPKHVATLRSSVQITHGLEWDFSVRYVSSLPHPAQSAYVEGDTKITYRVGGGWEFSLVGQNLFDKAHAEFGDSSISVVQVQRSFYGSVTWQF
ncbi:MAG TPA: TonB-dependent receptor [Opitutaceae bacterium]|nr:TonB-dependent receptor [Opitutaceae bacterium]